MGRVILCGVTGAMIGPSGTSDDVLRADGKAATQSEIKIHAEKHGPKPQYSSYDGSFEEVKKYLKTVLNDPGSVDYDFWSKVVVADNGSDIRVRYRAKMPSVPSSSRIRFSRCGTVPWLQSGSIDDCE